MEISWRFPPLSGGTKQGYTNNDIEAFKGEELIDNLAREICQNSLDAKNESVEGPVRVVFELKQIQTDRYDVFSGYKKSLSGCREFWSASGNIDAKLDVFLTEAENTIRKPYISILVASDFNTKGLCGNHDLDNISTPWEALTGADGMSVKPDDNSGGSYGIGKNAPFACSALSMVFYNTWDADDNKAFIGVGRLATLYNESGKPTQRVGRYQNNDDEAEKWLPVYETDKNDFRDLFIRQEHGTDVIIAGFNEVDNWKDDVSKAVLKNFFIAISEKKLVVEIKDGDNITRIDDSTLANQIEKYAQDDVKQMEKTRQLFIAYSNPDIKHPVDILDEKNAVEIYVKTERSFARTIANFRSTGMLVGLGSRRIFQHYAAVLIVRGEKLGELLRDCEPPRHNRWDYKLIKGEVNKDKRNRAKDALDCLESELLALLKSQFETPAGDTTDAPGVSAYLADTEDGTLPDDATGKDILKVKIKIGKPKIKKTSPTITNIPGTEREGKETADTDTGNQGTRIGPNPPTPPGPFPGPGPGPVPGPNPGPSPTPVVRPGEEPTSKGVVKGNGKRSISVKELSKRRIFPMNPQIGLYKAVLLPSKDYEKLYVECGVVGEDGSFDTLEFSKFMFHGESIPCNKAKAGPMRVQKDVPAEFMITFKSKGKMALSLFLSEEG